MWGEHLILFAIYLARYRHTCVGFQLIKEPITGECSTCCYKLSVSSYISGSWCGFRSFVSERSCLILIHIYSLILLIYQEGKIFGTKVKILLLFLRCRSQN